MKPKQFFPSSNSACESLGFNPDWEILLGIGLCRNMQKLSHNKGGMNMYEPSTDWFGYVRKFILSLDEPHGGGMGLKFVEISWRPDPLAC